jgi:hypothetical protein
MVDLREDMMKITDTEPTGRENGWAAVRMALGMAQMMGAVIAFYLLLATGMNDLSLGAVAVTCFFTTVSVMLLGRRKDSAPDYPGSPEAGMRRFAQCGLRG